MAFAAALLGAVQLIRIRAFALAASPAPGTRLAAARSPELVGVTLAHAAPPPGWGRQHGGFVMKRPGKLSLSFTVPSSGLWEVWLQGQIMPSLALGIDGRERTSIAGQLSGNSLVPDTIRALTIQLAAGRHEVSLTRSGAGLAPGGNGSAVLDAIFLTPAGAGGEDGLSEAARSDWRSLCGRRYDWVELLHG